MEIALDLVTVFSTRDQIVAGRQELDKLEAQMRSDTAFARQVGAQVVKAEEQFTKAASAYARFAALVGLNQIPGLSGLGSAPLIIGGIALTTWLWVVASATALWLILRPLIQIAGTWAQTGLAKATTSVAAEQNRTIILNQAGVKDAEAQNAQRRGDIATARKATEEAAQLRAQAGSPGTAPPTGDTGEWLKENWPWLAAGAAALFIVPEILDRI